MPPPAPPLLVVIAISSSYITGFTISTLVILAWCCGPLARKAARDRMYEYQMERAIKQRHEQEHYQELDEEGGGNGDSPQKSPDGRRASTPINGEQTASEDEGDSYSSYTEGSTERSDDGPQAYMPMSKRGLHSGITTSRVLRPPKPLLRPTYAPDHEQPFRPLTPKTYLERMPPPPPPKIYLPRHEALRLDGDVAVVEALCDSSFRHDHTHEEPAQSTRSTGTTPPSTQRSSARGGHPFLQSATRARPPGGLKRAGQDEEPQGGGGDSKASTPRVAWPTWLPPAAPLPPPRSARRHTLYDFYGDKVTPRSARGNEKTFFSSTPRSARSPRRTPQTSAWRRFHATALRD